MISSWRMVQRPSPLCSPATLREWRPPADSETEPEHVDCGAHRAACAEAGRYPFSGPLTDWIKNAAAAKNTPARLRCHVAARRRCRRARIQALDLALERLERGSNPLGSVGRQSFSSQKPSYGRGPRGDLRLGARVLLPSTDQSARSDETDAAVAEANDEAWQAKVKAAAKDKKRRLQARCRQGAGRADP